MIILVFAIGVVAGATLAYVFISNASKIVEEELRAVKQEAHETIRETRDLFHAAENEITELKDDVRILQEELAKASSGKVVEFKRPDKEEHTEVIEDAA